MCNPTVLRPSYIPRPRSAPPTSLTQPLYSARPRPAFVIHGIAAGDMYPFSLALMEEEDNKENDSEQMTLKAQRR